MGAFAEELPDFHASIDEIFGQSFTWAPMMEAADVNAAPIADTSRTGCAVRGVFFDKEAKEEMAAGLDPRLRGDMRPGVVAGLPRIEILPGGLNTPVSVQRMDILTAESGARWRVFSAFTTKTGVQVCALNALG